MNVRSRWERVWAIAGRVRIRWKILGIAVGSVVLLGLIFIVADREATRRSLREDLKAKGASTARQFAAANADALLTNDLFGIHRSLQSGLEAEPDLAYAFFHDIDGEVVADTFPWGFPQSLTALIRVPGSSDPDTVPISTDAGLVWNTSEPVLDGRAGWVHVGLSEQRIDAAVRDRTRDMALLTLLVAGVATFGAFGLATVLSAPIRRLQTAAEAVAGGDLGQRVDVWARDEIGELTRAFNLMTRRLEHSRATLVRQNRELRVLNAVTASMASATSLDETLDAALESLREAFEAEAAWVVLTDRDGETARVIRHSGLPGSSTLGGDELEPTVARSCACLHGLRARPGAVVRRRPGACRLFAPAVLERSGIAAHATVAVRSRGESLGVLSVGSRDEARFDDSELRLLDAVGSALGVAVDNAGLWEDIRRRDEQRGRLIDRIFEAQEEERRRIAREIHDHTNQVLSSLIVSVDVAHQSLARHDERLAGVLDATRAECEATLGRLDDLVLELRPKLLDDLGLAPGIEWLLQEFEARSGVRTRFSVEGLHGRIAADVETAAFRITQEALANVTKHAAASSVEVRVQCANGLLELSVRDDGTGFDLEQVGDSGLRHFGLLGMRERAALTGGTLAVTSAPGSGTCIDASLPSRGTKT